MDETIKGLNKTIQRLRKENELLSVYKERSVNMKNRCMGLEKQLLLKRNVVKVLGYKKENSQTPHILNIIDCIDTPEGMFIKVIY